jgi:hypothetical protein
VLPAEDKMQAFLWRHLVPSQDLLAYVRDSQWGPITIEPDEAEPVRIPVGGTATVHYKSPGWRVPLVEMRVSEPKEGLAITDFTSEAQQITVTVEATGEAGKAGLAANLVVEGIVIWEPSEEQRKANPDAPPPQPSSIGILPAVPFAVVEP